MANLWTLKKIEELFEEQNLILCHINKNVGSLYNEVSFHTTKMWLFMQYVFVMRVILK